MKRASISEKLVLNEVTTASTQLRSVLRGMHIGVLVRSIRMQLGMSQKALANRAGVIQSTISRVEQGQENIELSTLNKILRAMCCDLVVAPLLRKPIDSTREEQAKKIAQKRAKYLSGTMHLEQQQPDRCFIDDLLKQEVDKLLQGPSTQLWEE